MMNQSASVSRGPPAGSTATAGCCPMLAHHPNFYIDRDRFAAATLPPPPPTATHRNILGLQQPSSAQVLPPAPTSQAPVSNHQVVHQQPNSNSATSLVGANLTTGNNNQMPPQQQTTGLQGNTQATTNLTRDPYSTSTDSPHTLPLQHLLARSLPPPNCMTLGTSFQQQLQLHQIQQRHLRLLQQLDITPINNSQQQTTITNNNSTTAPSQQPPAPPLAPLSQTTNNTSNTNNTNQVPIVNFNNNASAIPPFLNLPAPALLAAHLNDLTNNSNNHHQQATTQTQEPVPLQTQQANQQAPPSPAAAASAPQPPIPQLPNYFYSLAQMEQALAILTNPQVAGNLFSHVFNIYLQGGLRTEPHHTHHHHYPPHHYHHHIHGSHHHHHHNHGPNGQNNGQDDTMLTMSESKPRGLTRAEIDSLTPYIQMNEKDSTTCVICLSKFELKSKIRPLPCSHAFHAKCVDKWLRANRTCPICRRDALKTYRSKIKRI